MSIDRIGDPFVPAILEGVVAHVQVRPSGAETLQVRVVLNHRGAKPYAYGHADDVLMAVCKAVAEDVERRPAAYTEAFDRLEAARELARDGPKRERPL